LFLEEAIEVTKSLWQWQKWRWGWSMVKVKPFVDNLVGIELIYFNGVSQNLGISAIRQLGSLATLILRGQSFVSTRDNIRSAVRQSNSSVARQLGSFTNFDNVIT
jgi:hypothetical protein